MIDLALTLADYLIKFLQKRDDTADEYFERYVTPAYEAAETVFSDYLTILTTLRERIIQREKPEELMNFLESERNRYLSRRMRLRAEIASRFNATRPMEELPMFEKGILGILLGGVATFGQEHRVNNPYFGYGNHTLLTLLSNFSFYTNAGWDYGECLNITEKQITTLHLAWQDVVNGYAKYKMEVVPTPSNKTFTKKDQKSPSVNNKEIENMPLKLTATKTVIKSTSTKSVSKKMGYKRDGD